MIALKEWFHVHLVLFNWLKLYGIYKVVISNAIFFRESKWYRNKITLLKM